MRSRPTAWRRAQLVLDKPQQTIGGADAREARRVELRLQ